MTAIHLHLVSHASGELIEMLARNSIAQLDGVVVERRLWKMVRHLGQLPDILAAVGETRGFVLHSLAATDLREALEGGCERLAVPCVFALEPLVTTLSETFDAPIRYRSSARDLIDEGFYRRIEAMKYSIGHDDGSATGDLADADVIVVGVSRATKTPTCMYLASLGVKAANVPLVPGVSLPDEVTDVAGPLVVGLTIDPARLAVVRAARMRALRMDPATDYTDEERLRGEVLDARRLFVRHGWPVIDVTHRSIEQTASMIMRMLDERGAPPPV